MSCRHLVFWLLALTLGCSKEEPTVVQETVSADPAATSTTSTPVQEPVLQSWTRFLTQAKFNRNVDRATAVKALLEWIEQNHEPEQTVAASLAAIASHPQTNGLGWYYPGQVNSTTEAVVAVLAQLGPAGEMALDQQVLPSIIEQLESPDPAVRYHMAWTLRRLGNRAEPARPALVQRTADPIEDVRKAAYGTLHQLGVPAEMVPKITQHLQHDDEAVRLDAAYALYWLPAQPAALPDYLVALRDEKSTIQNAGAEAIGKLGPAAAPAVPELIQQIQAIEPDQLNQMGVILDQGPLKALGRIGEPAVAPLSQLLSDPNPASRYQAALLLGRMGQPAHASLASLAALMRREEAFLSVKLEAAVAVVQLGGDSAAARGVMTPLLKHPQASVRAQAVWALGRVGRVAEPAVPDLIRLLDDPVELVRSQAILTLESLGAAARPAVPALGVRISDNDVNIRDTALRILRGLGPAAADALPDVLELIRDREDPAEKLVRVQGAHVLAACGKVAAPAIPVLVEAIQNGNNPLEVRTAFVKALKAMGPAAKAGIARLAELLASERDVGLRIAILDAVGELRVDQPNVIQAIIQRLDQDRSSAVRVAATTSLARLGPPAKAAIPSLQKVLESKYANGPRKVWAAAALVRLRPAQANQYIPEIFKALGDVKAISENAHETMLSTALQALAVLDQAATPMLARVRELVNDRNPRVRIAALQCLVAIEPEDPATLTALIQGLDAADWTIRREAVQLLGELGPTAAAAEPRLQEVLQTEQDLREEARRSLALIQS